MTTPDERLARLSPEQRRLLELRLAGRRGDTHPSIRRPLRFSLFFFSADADSDEGERYELVMEAARFADAHGLRAIWTPERHFHRFGGLYPSPAVLSAALVAVTERLQVRAGSVVMPLHHPIRVAEEWAVLDNLSNGRIGISFASGWSPQDFVFAPEAYDDRKAVTFAGLDIVRRLWRGESVSLPAGRGEVDVRIRPRPVQPELPVWVSSVGSGETAEQAGVIGANLLTALLRQTIEQAAGNIATYRAARAAAGHDPATGEVAVMMHTFLGESVDAVRAQVSGPLTDYLSTYLELLHDVAGQLDLPADVTKLAGDEREALAAHALERYLTSNGLFGTPESVLPLLGKLTDAGVDEVACLLDFGLDKQTVMAGLRQLVRLRDLVDASASPSPGRTTSAVDTAGPKLVPASSAQRRLWFLDRMAPGKAAYHVRSIVRMTGEVDACRLRRALEAICQRHEPLRTSIRFDADGPVQVVAPSASVGLREIVVSESELDERLQAEIGEPFDLSAGPLWRAALFSTSDTDHVLAITLHHIIADGWSVAVLQRELTKLYLGWRSDPDIPVASLLPELTTDYSAVVTRAPADGSQEQRRDIDYWVENLAKAPPRLHLPRDRPMPAIQTYAGAVKRFVLATEICNAVRDLTRTSNATVFMVLLAGYALALAGHSGQRDIVVGSPVAGRRHPGDEQLIGLFTDTLPLRIDLRGDPSLEEFLGRVRRTCLAAYDHQDAPLEKITEALDLPRDPAYPALFQAVLVSQGRPQTEVDTPGMVVERYEIDSATAKFPLVLDVSETEAAISGNWEYNTDLFAPADIDALHSDWLAALARLVAGSGESVESFCAQVSNRLADSDRAALADTRRANRERLRSKLRRSQASGDHPPRDTAR